MAWISKPLLYSRDPVSPSHEYSTLKPKSGWHLTNWFKTLDPAGLWWIPCKFHSMINFHWLRFLRIVSVECPTHKIHWFGMTIWIRHSQIDVTTYWLQREPSWQGKRSSHEVNKKPQSHAADSSYPFEITQLLRRRISLPLGRGRNSACGGCLRPRKYDWSSKGATRENDLLAINQNNPQSSI